MLNPMLPLNQKLSQVIPHAQDRWAMTLLLHNVRQDVCPDVIFVVDSHGLVLQFQDFKEISLQSLFFVG